MPIRTTLLQQTAGTPRFCSGFFPKIRDYLIVLVFGQSSTKLSLNKEASVLLKLLLFLTVVLKQSFRQDG